MPSSPPPIPEPARVVQFLHLATNLKTTPRTGWVKRNVKDPESIADHMYRMSLMALLMEGNTDGYDVDRCIKLAIVHDLAECIAGDITPVCGVSDGEKYRMESEAMDTITSMLGDNAASRNIRALWDEYERGETKEAKLVKDFDKVEMIVQAGEYERDQGERGVELQEFFDSTAGKWRTDVGKSWAQVVTDERARRSS
jgi:putative hydrolase of HD superfamily